MSKNYNYCLEDYIKVINILNSEYFTFLDEWSKASLESDSRMNFKRKQIRDIYNIESKELDPKFLNLIRLYYDLIERLHIKIKIEILKEANIKIESRIKDFDSLLFKINKKCYEDNGRYAINKAVNDILGFRLIDFRYDENIDSIYKYIESAEHLDNMNRVKIIKRNIEKEDSCYQGTHIYFRGKDNFCIPIELQLWDKKNEETNRDSHRKHKQGYIDSIEGYKSLNI